MSKLLNIPKAEWKGFFERMSKALLGKWAEIEVASLDLGDQIVAEWIPLLGITYDSKDDLVDVALDRANHLIRGPKEIVVEETAEGIASVAVADHDGARQIIRLKQPLALPPVTSGVGA
jgi:hypothetical protein